MTSEKNRDAVGWIAGIAAVLGLALAAYLMWDRSHLIAASDAPSSASTSASAPAGTSDGLVPKYPLPAVPTTAPLPALERSDAALTDALTRLLDKGSLGMFFYNDRIVRRIVATVDNLPRSKIAANIAIAKPVPEAFVVETRNDQLQMAPANAARYVRVVQLLSALDTRAAVEQYTLMYPLFQRAYQDLGYPNGHFNDRLMEVIDHLLAAPEAPVPLPLTQPKVRYEYADPALESASSGWKIMWRIGPSNAALVKAKLSELRTALAQASNR